MRNRLWRIPAALALLLCAGLLPLSDAVALVLCVIGYALVGWDVLWEAVCNIARGRVFDENFLMAVATVGAWCVGERLEAVGVMVFYQLGEYFQDRAVRRSRRSIAQLMDIRPDRAELLRDGAFVDVAPEEVPVGATIRVSPGDRVPLDGVVLEGTALLDTAALTGEPVPRQVRPGDELLSGCIVQNAVLTALVMKPYGESTVSRILELVEDAAGKKSRTERFISRFSSVYTPAVVIAAAALAVIPSLITGQWSAWLYRALTFLVVSCPCALVISVPLSFFGGIGGASRIGVLIKGSNDLEALSHVDTVVFDKTGTLTRGDFAVQAVHCAPGVDRKTLLSLAASAEQHSPHPIAKALLAASAAAPSPAEQVEEHTGRGVSAQVAGHRVLAGSARLMTEEKIENIPEIADAGTLVHVAADGRYLGCAVIADQLKPDAAAAVDALRDLGVRKTVMLSGDRERTAQAVGSALGLDQVCAELLPGDKLEKLEQLLRETPERHSLVYVGDGLNDAPVLARADVGVAMGALGSDAAIEAADVVLMTDELSRLAPVIALARKTMGIVRQNIIFALGIKVLVLILGAFGIANLWLAVFADVGVALLAILNALRCLHPPRNSVVPHRPKRRRTPPGIGLEL